MFSPSEDQCLCDFTIKVNENQIDATFIALEIYLKLSNKWTKESALQDWFLQRQWIMGNKENNVWSRIKCLDQFFLSQNVQFSAYILYIHGRLTKVKIKIFEHISFLMMMFWIIKYSFLIWTNFHCTILYNENLFKKEVRSGTSWNLSYTFSHYFVY